MLLNYLKLAIRLLIRNPFFTFINVLGLSVGFAVFFILWPYSHSQLKSDQFIKGYDKIVRLLVDFRWTDNDGETWGEMAISVAPSYVGSELSFLQGGAYDVTRFITQPFFSENKVGLGTEIIAAIGKDSRDAKLFKTTQVICGDKNFFQFFNFPLVHGESSSVLSKPESVVLSESIAAKFFKNEHPLHKVIKLNGRDFQVTGVFLDMPENSHFKFEIVISNAGKLSIWNSDPLNGSWAFTYCKTHDPELLSRILNENIDHFAGSYLKKSPHIRIKFYNQPFEEIVFSHNIAHDHFASKSKFLLHILALVSFLVLIMAWMNYINLTISKTHARFKEIAARKVSGALMKDLFLQFICQALVINVIAALIGITLIQLGRQPFYNFFDIKILGIPEINIGTFIFFILIFFAGILLTALYPAWIAFQFSTRQLLNKRKVSQKRIIPSILTTFQYCAALVLVAWICVVYFQLDFILKKDVGLNKDQVIVIESPIIGPDENKLQQLLVFTDRLQNIPGVEKASVSYAVLGETHIDAHLRHLGNPTYFGNDSPGGVDENFIPLYNIKILDGRNFVKDEKLNSIIISEYTSQRLGFKTPQEAVGAMIEVNNGQADSQIWKTAQVIGVVADYRVSPFYFSQHTSETFSGRGQSFTYLDQSWKWLVPQRISFRTSDFKPEALHEVEKLFQETFPGNLFTWYFLNDHVARHYTQQKIARNQILFFTLLAICVACLGLLGMISNKVVEKTKEIGIRKILGAGWIHIASILLDTTGKQIIFAVIIAIPSTWYLSEQYLSFFIDRIPFQWWHYLLPLAVLVTVMVITISSTLIKAARTNPVESLRYE